MDAAPAGRQTGRMAACSFDFARDGPASAAKNELPPHWKEYWAIPPEDSAEFVAAREDVLEIYQRPLAPAPPVLCREESSQQWVGERRGSLPAAPGQPRREDYEYARNGVATLFLFCEPLTGGREVPVTERRTRTEGAGAMRALCHRPYPAAERITVRRDKLTTPGPASF
jgi:hypothetical protein